MCHAASDASPFGTGSTSTERTFAVQSDDAAVPVFEAAPAGPPAGSVIIIHDIWGANTFYHDLARRLAGVGLRAWLPDLFVREGALAEQTFEAARARGSRLSSRQALADLTRMVDELAACGDRVATLGFCMGGTLVMLLAAREERVAAGVIYYGFPANANPSAARPFTPLDEAARVSHPLLGFWGDQDYAVGMDSVARYAAALDAAGKLHTFIIYPGMPHGFLTFDPANEHFDASQKSWESTLAFFAEHLGPA